jgi:gamma-glutamylcysteine synthetase
MIRTQIQLPDELYARARRVAKAKEISLAELARRGIEAILDQYRRRS